MAYVAQSEVEAKIPAPILNDALDDDRDGKADTGKLDDVIGVACNAVDAYLAGVFSVPFAAAPAPVKEAALVFACEAIYQRRGVSAEENPFSKQADVWRIRLEKIGNRELPLEAGQTKAVTPGAVITECIKANAQST